MYGWIVVVLFNIYFVLWREDISKRIVIIDYDGLIFFFLFDKGKYYIKLLEMIYLNNNIEKMRK